MYQALCGRTVDLCDLRGPLFQRLTEGWPLTDVLDLLKRIDLILEVLAPRKDPPA